MIAPRNTIVVNTILLIIIVFSFVPFFSPVSAAHTSIVEVAPGSYSHKLGTSENIVRLDYPKGAIMLNTTGDLIFNLTTTTNHTSIHFYIPPEFSFVTPDTTSVWTSLTNDYRSIFLGKTGDHDEVAPGWWIVKIENRSITFGTYIIRLFNVEAPNIQGRYFFKVFLDRKSIGADRFPTLTVKGGLNPAYISGRILCGRSSNSYTYGQPVNMSGTVQAIGTTLEGRTVRAQTYFNASANGSYTLYGLAAGTYELTASAASFAPEILSRTVSVMPGQSLIGVDIYLNPGTQINGTAWSKCSGELQPWGKDMQISIELLNLEEQVLRSLRGNVSAGSDHYDFLFDKIQMDGHVPQDEADYISGLENGDYFLRGYINGYVQRDVVVVAVFNQREIGGVRIDLFKSGWIEVTVHFTDHSTIRGHPLSESRRLTLDVFDVDGTLRGSNSTLVQAGSLNWTMEVIGFHGFPEGSYMIMASITGYTQPVYPRIAISDCGGASKLSIVMVRSGSVNITIRSVNWQKPPSEVEWAYPDAPIQLELYSPWGESIKVDTSQPYPPKTTVTVNATDLLTGMYFINVYTVGYVQTQVYSFSAVIGGATCLSIDLVKGAKIHAEIKFMSEDLLSPIDTYHLDEARIPVRVEVYDSLLNFVGANITHISKCTSFEIDIVGFRQYTGNPSYRWINYYDTTESIMQLDYGLISGAYTVKVWVPGYLQDSEVTITPPLSGSATVIFNIHRLSHLQGFVSGFDMFDGLLPLSWVTVTAFNGVACVTYTMDGYYDLWLPYGRYTLTFSSIGFDSQVTSVYLAPGSESVINKVMVKWEY